MIDFINTYRSQKAAEDLKKRVMITTTVLRDGVECEIELSHIVPDDVIVMPSLRSAKMAATDKVYRDMERGSEVRAQAAADLVGAPVAEMSSLKITNLKDNQREGDIAAMESQAAMDRFKTFTPTPVGWQANGAELASGVASGAVSVNNQVYAGIEPRAGARAIERVQRKLGIV